MRLSGYFSIIGCTPPSALNSNVSCESRAMPEYHPDTDRLPMINGRAPTISGSVGAAGTNKFPFTAKPSTTPEIASDCAFAGFRSATREVVDALSLEVERNRVGLHGLQL